MTEIVNEQMPLGATLGIRTSGGPDEVDAVLAWAPELCAAGGVLHGGVLMALADSASSLRARPSRLRRPSRRPHDADPGRPRRGLTPDDPRYPVPGAVAVAQLVEPRVVVPVVAGSSPVRHPYVGFTLR